LAQPRTVAEVVQILREIEDDLSPDDGMLPFVSTYRRMTEQVGDFLVDGRFADPEFLERLDVVFANLFLQPMLVNEDAPKCWRVLFRVRDPGPASERHPLQLAVAGMNAHINYDLAVALVQTCQEFDRAPETDSPVHADYLVVNDVLAAAFDEVKEELIKSGPLHLVDRLLGEVDDHLGLWSIAAARNAAWERAEMLWATRHIEFVQQRYLSSHDRLTALVGRALLA